MKTILLFGLVGYILFVIATTSFGQALDYRLCDDEGHCAEFTSDGKLQTS